ncbi:MAG: hypothetical protein ACRCUT_07850, partial [Spirochaetota bacterium]
AAYLLKDMPLKAKIVSRTDNGEYIIDAGQWHGIKEDGSLKTDAGRIRILQSGRFQSLVSCNAELKGDVIVVYLDQRIDRIIQDLNERISAGIIRKQGIEYVKLNGDPHPEKRLIAATLIINPGASLAVPGYGAYLSTYYMGFNAPKPAWDGMTAGIAAELFQIMAVPVMTEFEGNFFPWIDDADKNRHDRSLHRFLWYTIPATFAVTYFDQLTYQYQQHKMLPPCFRSADAMAAASSFFIPGGGLFYKGYRLPGWGYYAAEMGLLSWSVYHWNSRSGRYGAAAFCAVKALDILSAWCVEPGYDFYNREYERKKAPSPEFSVVPDGDAGLIFCMGIKASF